MEHLVGAMNSDSLSTDKNSTVNQTRGKKQNKKMKRKKIQKTKNVDNYVENGQTDGCPIPDECFLKKNHLIQMQKLVPNDHPGVYKCKVCTILLDSIKNIHQHIKEDRHIFNVENFEQTVCFKLLEEPPLNILLYLDFFLENTISSIALQPSDHDTRLKLAAKINNIVKYQHSDWSVELYGSSMTGLGLKDSNVNLNLSIPTEAVGQGVFELLAKLQTVSFAGNVKLDFGSNLPRIKFTDVDSGLECEISVNNNNSVALSNLLMQYKSIDKRFRQLVILFRYWAKICGIDRADIGMLPTCALDVLVVYYLQQLKRPLLPVIIYYEKEKRYNLYRSWKIRNEFSIAQLWLGILKYYTLEINLREFTVSVATKAIMKRKAKNWSVNILSIEEPGSSKRNLGNTLVKNVSYKYLQNCFGETFKYFSTPQSRHGPIYSNICVETDVSQSQIKENDDVIKRLLAEDVRFKALSATVHKVIRTDICKTLVLIPRQATWLAGCLQKHHLKYDFSKQNFTGGMDIPIVCIICHEEGHKSLECTKGLLPLETLPTRSASFFEVLSNVCHFVENKLAITSEEIQERKRIVKELEYYLSNLFPQVNLELFGSTYNGFGLKKSDLDICLTFLSPTNKAFTLPNLINKLVAHLRRCTMVSNLLPITTARVPIVKFTHCESKLDGDISIYNVLAQRNTKMLRLYSEIDERAKILGFVMKKFAKLCNIGDASRGSLSSYAYILIVIYFLQQCKPPVLPVLQEIEIENATSGDIVSSCNTYFYSDIKNLHLKWPEYGKNSTSVGELWLELLNFYSEEFDFENYVISIRRKHPLLKFEKLWKSKFIKIEDPFDINHNLGSALSRNMHNFILNTFRKGRNHFGTAAENAVYNLSPVALESFFFNQKQLTPGKVPADKICRWCKKIGHTSKTCHLRNQSSAQFTEQNNLDDRRWPNGDRLNLATFQKSKANSNPKETNYVETRVFANKSYVHETYEHHPFDNQGQHRDDRSDAHTRNSSNMSHIRKKVSHFRNGKVDTQSGMPSHNFEFLNRGFSIQAERVEFHPSMYAANNIEKKLESLERSFGKGVLERKKNIRHNYVNLSRLQPRDCDGEASKSVSTPVVDIKVPM